MSCRDPNAHGHEACGLLDITTFIDDAMETFITGGISIDNPRSVESTAERPGGIPAS